MTAEKAIEMYSEKYGGFPYMLFMGAEDKEIVAAVEKALKENKEIMPENADADY